MASAVFLRTHQSGSSSIGNNRGKYSLPPICDKVTTVLIRIRKSSFFKKVSTIVRESLLPQVPSASIACILTSRFFVLRANSSNVFRADIYRCRRKKSIQTVCVDGENSTKHVRTTGQMQTPKAASIVSTSSRLSAFTAQSFLMLRENDPTSLQ